jgi:glycosyltransferase involved in cell wall biosynthesis
MMINVIHVISSFSKINFGIWNAALFGTNYLKSNYGLNSAIIVCDDVISEMEPKDMKIIRAGADPKISSILSALQHFGFTKSDSLIVSHGCWLKPSWLGYHLQKNGFNWLAVPHGMLEPWSMSNSYLKKKIYYSLFERKYILHADAIRAVGKIEQGNLARTLNRSVEVVENGVATTNYFPKTINSVTFLFMARLHKKKGIVPLVQAWAKVMRDTDYQLVIAGPDEGELERIKPFFSDNVKYVGPQYGEEKRTILRDSHYYLLPSFSEGFPTSVLEAMSYGLIPLISQGCNFPEVFEKRLGYQIEPDIESITTLLIRLKDKSFDQELSARNHSFIGNYFSEPTIGNRLFDLYSGIQKKIK